MYSSKTAYEQAMNDIIDRYEVRELAAIALLARFCKQIPLESEVEDLAEDVKQKFLLAVYHQIKFDYDNDLLDSNGTITSATIGKFSYSKNSINGRLNGTGDRFSNTAINLLKDSGLCENVVHIKKSCSVIDEFLRCNNG